jgi:hypothetical protein
MPRPPHAILRDLASRIQALDSAQKQNGAGAPPRRELQDLVVQLVAQGIQPPPAVRDIADHPCPTAGANGCLPDVGGELVRVRHTRRTILKQWRQVAADRNRRALADIGALLATPPDANTQANASPEPNTSRTELPLISLGDRNYQIGTETVVVDDIEETVLQAFFYKAPRKPKWIALDYKELRRRSSVNHAPRILGRMRQKYPQLAAVIDCPGVRGMGGLKVFLTGSGRSR